ncbi:GNAT family N-acetyltransferase [Tenggerimyces flavus]|uniref:GNAT family N-acetyltransferase n=1 Tax=Tenggerimyces flavus TaxID=1708749 RepID=A0ABV7YHW5_9ACTN|nr:GNAT family N-acetyltransferase [Tenggerimyces flavus]MBM7787846.1 ribosomal protein S18 acetylase RimI-like enzyme [Tenggerimyces flavus]
MPETTVTPATLHDVDFLIRLLGDVYGRDPDEQAQAHNDARTQGDVMDQVLGMVENSTTYIIHAAGERVGRLRVVRTPERSHLAGIQIHPAHQGSGIGTTVITSVLAEARERNVPVELEVAKDNPNAERLYVRLGFRRFGEQGNDYLMTTAV